MSKTYIFDLSVDAWITNIEINADTLEQAKEKLHDMSVVELIEEGYVKDFSLRNIDYEVEQDR